MLKHLFQNGSHSFIFIGQNNLYYSAWELQKTRRSRVCKAAGIVLPWENGGDIFVLPWEIRGAGR